MLRELFKSNKMEAITQTLLNNWHFMRWLRLGLGLFVGYQAIMLHDVFAGIISGLFLFQAFTNTGCGGASGCSVPTTAKNSAKEESIEYEEVKAKDIK